MVLALLIITPLFSVAVKPQVTFPAIQGVENGMENSMRRMWPQDPVDVVGLVQGMYINGYGAAFASTVNLAPGPGITPFHQTISKDEVTRTHLKKLDRLPKFKEAMSDMLASSAASLDTVPGDEQVTLGISFFYWNWEDTTGLPAQIVMRAQKKVLVGLKSGTLSKTALASAMQVQEF